MRLTHIKLAGFKSFVDPTHIPVPGKLVGVVGPNGCGKSNVIDAVRWVLGETSAKQLRGENMQDVIFAGSSDRKPMSRASVELIFDNSAGKVTGIWSQYSEISVKRVLEREGASSYYINNQHVRRRDVADIFLGTGLGGRGYAIIEQGMISRIIEARPDDMRSFLEEAAGVSKYKERRRETELRLKDTRENLSRVEDIRSELDKQLRKLEQQAQQAEKFHEYENGLKETQQQVWFHSQRDSENKRQVLEAQIKKTEVDVEKKIALLRKTETEIEKLKISRENSAAVVNEVQAALYEVNSLIARIEQSIEHLRETRKRTQHQLSNVDVTYEQQRYELRTLEQDFWDARKKILLVKAQQNQNLMELESNREELPDIEQSFSDAQRAVDEHTKLISDVQNRLNISRTHQSHASNVLEQLANRKKRLNAERLDLKPPDSEQIQSMDDSIKSLDNVMTNQSNKLSNSEAELVKLEDNKDKVGLTLDEKRRVYSELDAKRRALVELQTQLSRSDRLSEWLDSSGFNSEERLWELLRVEAGWEDAVEAVLRERLMSIATDDLGVVTFEDANQPPSKVSFFNKRFSVARSHDSSSNYISLGTIVHTDDSSISNLLEHWLAHVFIAETDVEARAMVDHLESGQICVTKRGDLHYPGGVALFAPDQEVHGVLARQVEIEALDKLTSSAQDELESCQNEFKTLSESVSRVKEELAHSRKDYADLKEKLHHERVDFLRLSDLNQRTIERLAQVDTELVEIDALQLAENERNNKASQDVSAFGVELETTTSVLEQMISRLQSAKHLRETKLETIQNLNESYSEYSFESRSLVNKISQLSLDIKQIYESFIRLDGQRSELTEQLNRELEGEQTDELQSNLLRRQQVESELSLKREALSGWDEQLRAAELQRQETDLALQPLRDSINALNLSEQECRLVRDGFMKQLSESGADEERLGQVVPNDFDLEIAQTLLADLQLKITRLGAINLAALDELTESKERKGYLDAQAEDLLEAVATLENAIRSIDKETRERLSETFEQVNQQFGEMFPALFGGGEAKLVLTGEEILDAGVEVIARPPGKRNTSIHLLSGGEKALTALSLVFSLFQLNPAPFCLLDEVDAPLDDSNTVRYCDLVRKMSQSTQFLFITHNKITMELAEQLIGVTMQEQGVSRVVAVDIEEAMKLNEDVAA
ncbi:MAG: chromosome segregation protein SMC [Burkholderiales bacterium]|nr:chromosome segregation protein SMC [Burkholderiales bacterium]MBL6879091.1 chromosome segregation protein SMC [Burkholderiales bacterium]